MSVWLVVTELPEMLKSTVFENFSSLLNPPFRTAKYEKISKNVDFSLLRQTLKRFP